MGRPARVSREEVLSAAREVFSERGYDAATLTAIASRVGISPAALLRHAPGKEALFAAAMSAGESDFPLPMDFLPEVDADEDPRRVLRRIAFAFLPFVEARLGESIARWMRSKVSLTLRLPFDPRVKPSPPQRALALLENYFRRASKAGRIKVRNPRVAALTFLGSLHAYVFLHRVVEIVDPPVPFDEYVESLLDIWSHGAIRSRVRTPARRAKRSPR